ncbi:MULTISPECIES: GH25 family lysozyme [Clostridium]|uniref:GH25 family lysozyme n=1 Tax=Clostridium TaxID=1485 RepID=UPI0008242186|nr:autolysin [Clostridium sp. CT7]
MKGIDIYSGQGSVDFSKVKSSGVDIVYIKATEGVTYTDRTVLEFYKRAKDAGFKVGFYHFLRNNNPINEAEHFLSAISGMNYDCKLAIDVEVTLGQTVDTISSNVRKFADYLISKGIDVCIYTYTSFYKNNLNSNVKNIPLWIAEYGVTQPNISTAYVGFQYSETGRINGISGSVDLNEFNDGIFINSKSLGVVSSTPVITVNDTVKIIQSQLNTLLKKNLAVDGINGYNTTAVIKEFQGIMGLVRDGIWGSKTVAAITEIFSRPLDGIKYRHYEYATRYIQYRVGGNIDGVYGNATEDNVKAWQAKHNLNADGIVGGITWSKFLDENC